MDLTATEEAALERDLQRLGVFFRIETDPVVRLWAGIGYIAPGYASDPAGALYKGFGQLANVPALAQLINGQADRVTLTISGKLPIASMLGVSSAAVKGKACGIGFALLGSEFELLGPVRFRPYRADALTAAQTEQADVTNPWVRTIALSIGSQMTNRRRPAPSYFTDHDQKRLSALSNPGGNPDRFCERTTLLSQLAQKTWPRF